MSDLLLYRYPYFRDGQFQYEPVQHLLFEEFKNAVYIQPHFLVSEENILFRASFQQWDSEFFKTKMARIDDIYADNEEVLEKHGEAFNGWCITNEIKYVSARVNINNTSSINYLFRQGYIQTSGKMLLQKKIAKAAGSQVQNQEYNLHEILAIAEGNFRENRFFKDSFFDKEKARMLYTQWLDNSVRKNLDRIITHREDGVLAGFVLFDILHIATKPLYGFVTLVAVDEKFKGRGIGKTLLDKAAGAIASMGIGTMYANVVSSNVPSLKLFQTSGYQAYATLLELRKVY